MSRVKIKKGYQTPITVTIKNSDGTAKDLSGYDSAKFYMKRDDGKVKVDGATATISDAANGEVTYTFTSSDVDTAGNYLGYFGFYVGATKTLAAPPDNFEIEITDDFS